MLRALLTAIARDLLSISNSMRSTQVLAGCQNADGAPSSAYALDVNSVLNTRCTYSRSPSSPHRKRSFVACDQYDAASFTFENPQRRHLRIGVSSGWSSPTRPSSLSLFESRKELQGKEKRNSDRGGDAHLVNAPQKAHGKAFYEVPSKQQPICVRSGSYGAQCFGRAPQARKLKWA